MKKLYVLLLTVSISVMLLIGCSEEELQNFIEEEISAQTDNNEGVTDKSGIKETVEDKPAVEEKKEENKPEPKFDFKIVARDGKAFRDYSGTPTTSFYMGVENTGNIPFSLREIYFDYEDDAGRLLGTDKYMVAIPDVILPGETGYVYSYYYSLAGIDYSNGFVPHPMGDAVPELDTYVIKISDINVKADYGNWVTVTARGTNDSGRDISFACPGAVFYDKDDNIIGFCYGVESFASGETKSFEISGSLISYDTKPSEIDRVEVCCVGSF